MAYERRRRAADQAFVRPDAVSPLPFIGMAGVACDFFLCGAAALLAPWWVVVALLLGWVLTLAAAVRWWTPAPQRIVVAAITLAVTWFAVIVAGGLAFGWRIS